MPSLGVDPMHQPRPRLVLTLTPWLPEHTIPSKPWPRPKKLTTYFSLPTKLQIRILTPLFSDTERYEFIGHRHDPNSCWPQHPLLNLIQILPRARNLVDAINAKAYSRSSFHFVSRNPTKTASRVHPGLCCCERVVEATWGSLRSRLGLQRRDSRQLLWHAAGHVSRTEARVGQRGL